MGARRPTPVETLPKPPIPVEKPVSNPVVMKDPGEIKIVLNVKATPAQIARVSRLSDVARKIINSPEFKARVLGAWYKGKAQFVDTKLSNAEVYQKLREGAELKTPVDYTWNLEIGIERSRCSTLGWTYPNVSMFWFNSCTFDTREDSGVTGTICHEYSHKLGFEHSQNATAARPYSVPYAVGTICAELYPAFK